MLYRVLSNGLVNEGYPERNLLLRKEDIQDRAIGDLVELASKPEELKSPSP